MSEQMFPMGGTAVAEPPAPLLPGAFDDSGSGDNRRKLAVVGAIVGVVVLLIAAFFLLKGGGSGAAPAAAAVPAGQPAAGGQPKAGQAHKPVKLPKAFDGHVGRDPFKALYTAPVAADPKTPKTADTGTGTGTGSTPSVPAPTTGDTGTTGGSTGSTGSTDTGSSPAASFAPVWVELVSVKGTKTASFVVGYSNGKRSKTVSFSDVTAPTSSLRTAFAGVCALLSIQDGTATVQFGDGTPFDLAPGFGNRHFVG